MWWWLAWIYSILGLSGGLLVVALAGLAAALFTFLVALGQVALWIGVVVWDGRQRRSPPPPPSFLSSVANPPPEVPKVDGNFELTRMVEGMVRESENRRKT